MSTMDFAPLVLPVSSVTEGLENSYKIISMSGEVVSVEAGSAAEAIEKSGVARPLRVISVAQEQMRMMARNLLHPEEKTVSTNIDLEKYVPDFRSLVVENVEERVSVPFAECSLTDLASRTMEKPLEKSAPLSPAVTSEHEMAPPPESEPVTAKEDDSPPLPSPPPVPAAQGTPSPEHELTEEEVDALMNGGELSPGEGTTP